MQDTLLALNTPRNCDANPGFFNDGGHNLSFPFGSCPTSFSSGDPKLGPLQNNGGLTETIAPGRGSAAIDQIPVQGSGWCPSTDQRGIRRPVGPACDIGAYEVAPPAVGAGTARATGAGSAVITAKVTANAGSERVWVVFGRTGRYGRRSAVKTIGGVTSSTVSFTLRGLDLRRVYHYRVVASSSDGATRSADTTLAVPFLRSLRLTPAFARAATATVSYSDSRGGITTFVVQRRVGRRWVSTGTFTFRERAGGNSFRLSPRAGRLAPGLYRLEVTPRHGRTIGFTSRLRFTIVP